ncbi:hypothetical protein BH10PSE18_BH10PSE18_08540 [soil metagenome]
MKFQVRDFIAAQQWPQPPLTLVIGNVMRSQRPDVRLIGEQTALEASFGIANSILDAFFRGDQLQAAFNGQKKSYPVPPEEMRRNFSRNCAVLVPESMRAD